MKTMVQLGDDFSECVSRMVDATFRDPEAFVKSQAFCCERAEEIFKAAGAEDKVAELLAGILSLGQMLVCVAAEQVIVETEKN